MKLLLLKVFLLYLLLVIMILILMISKHFFKIYLFLFRFPPQPNNEWLVGLNNMWKPFLT